MRKGPNPRSLLVFVAISACFAGLVGGWHSVVVWRRIFVQPVQPQRIDVAPGIVGIWTGSSYAFVLTTCHQRAVALVDAGSDKDAHALRAELAAQNHTDADVDHVFLTHGHADHTAGLAHFSQAQVHAHIDDAALIWGDQAPGREALRLFLRLHGKPLLRPFIHPLVAGQIMQHGQHNIVVVGLPGHTRGSVGFATGCGLLAGDAVGIAPITYDLAQGACAAPLPRSYNEHHAAACQSAHRAARRVVLGRDTQATGDNVCLSLAWLATGHGGVSSAVAPGPEDKCPPRQAARHGP